MESDNLAAFGAIILLIVVVLIFSFVSFVGWGKGVGSIDVNREAIEKQAACEAELPRNRRCAMQFVTEEKTDEGA